jgi:hypothetical protein
MSGRKKQPIKVHFYDSAGGHDETSHRFHSKLRPINKVLTLTFLRGEGDALNFIAWGVLIRNEAGEGGRRDLSVPQGTRTQFGRVEPSGSKQGLPPSQRTLLLPGS